MTPRNCLRHAYFFLRKLGLMLVAPAKAIREINPQEVTSIAAIRIDRIGDVVVSLPALKALKELFPQCHLAVVLKGTNAALLKSTPWIDELIPYRGFWRSAEILRKRHFSLAVDLLMDYTLKTALLACVSRAKIKAGFDIEARGRFFNIAVKPDKGKKTMSQYMLDLVKGIAELTGLGEEKVKDSIPQLKASDEDTAFAESFLREKGIQKGELVITMHPGGYFPTQRWRLDGFAQLADNLNRKYHARVMVMASGTEKEIVRRMVSAMKTKPCVISGFGLNKVAALIAQSDIFIGNNSGLLHIASALGKPTLSTMGPTVPHLWQPQGDNQVVIRRDLSCSPCNKGVCREHNCMESISVDEMEKAAGSMIEKLDKKYF